MKVFCSPKHVFNLSTNLLSGGINAYLALNVHIQKKVDGWVVSTKI